MVNSASARGFISLLLSTGIFGYNTSGTEKLMSPLLDSLNVGCRILFNANQRPLLAKQIQFIDHLNAAKPTLTSDVVAFDPLRLEDNIHLVVIDPSGKSVAVDHLPQYSFLVLHKHFPDRSCLLKPAGLKEKISGVVDGDCSDLRCFVRLVNRHCRSFYTESGDVSAEGVALSQLLSNRYSLRNSVTLEELAEKCVVDGNLKSFFYSGVCGAEKFYSAETDCGAPLVPQCDEIAADDLSQSDFVRNYLVTAKPLVIKGAAGRLRYFHQWTNEYLRAKFGQKELHLKLTPRTNETVGEFEGVEPLSMWQFDGSTTVPEAVRLQLKSPDLVVVRPAGVDMRLDRFLNDFVEERRVANVSAYLEYSSIRQLLADGEMLEELPYLRGLLKLDLTNVWLSDGNTIGKLHFDQYENLLVQISGRKQLILFQPYRNDQLYEGHIVEAMLTYREGKFRRETLLESTAMTMSPVDITRPDFKKFPRSRHLRPLNCTINSGDVLYLPGFFWHEVQSFPDELEKRNLALNYWYQPLFTKEFPCDDCPTEFNPDYRHLLSQFHLV